MADLSTYIWKDYRIKLVPRRGDIRNLVGILPYFWNKEIVFDLEITPKQPVKNDETWAYAWELVDIEEHTIKEGKGNIGITKREHRKYRNIRMGKALVLGYLLPNKHYQVFLNITNAIGEKSGRYSAATFTIKDKDEYQMQLLILLVGIGFAFIIAMLERGCG